MARLIVDTGFLVALYIRGDSLHQAAVEFLQRQSAALISVPAVVVETCFFLDAPGKREFLNWIGRGGVAVHDVPVSDYPEIARYIDKYADQDIDFADAALVWLANRIGEKSILTVDTTDFSIYRLKGSKRFEIVLWY
ncbi:MAG: PIN domain-containing protein [Candidatus Competibacteraceae bacterium]